jgi:hypothetical protein
MLHLLTLLSGLWLLLLLLVWLPLHDVCMLPWLRPSSRTVQVRMLRHSSVIWQLPLCLASCDCWAIAEGSCGIPRKSWLILPAMLLLLLQATRIPGWHSISSASKRVHTRVLISRASVQHISLCPMASTCWDLFGSSSGSKCQLLALLTLLLLHMLLLWLLQNGCIAGGLGFSRELMHAVSVTQNSAL